MGPNARVWRVYLDEAQKEDALMIDGWNRSMDVLLVFVRTTFLTLHVPYILTLYVDRLILRSPHNLHHPVLSIHHREPCRYHQQSSNPNHRYASKCLWFR